MEYPPGKIQVDEYSGVPRLWIGRRVHTGLVSLGYNRAISGKGRKKTRISIHIWELRDHGVGVGRFSSGRGGVSQKWVNKAREVFYQDHLAVLAWEGGMLRKPPRCEAKLPF